MNLNSYKSIRNDGIRACNKEWRFKGYRWVDTMVPFLQCYSCCVLPNELYVYCNNHAIEEIVFFDIVYQRNYNPNDNYPLSINTIEVENDFFIKVYYIPRGEHTEYIVNGLINGGSIHRCFSGEMLTTKMGEPKANWWKSYDIGLLSTGTLSFLKDHARCALKRINPDYRLF